MISRRTAKSIGEVYEKNYTYYASYSSRHGNQNFTISKDNLYDFLYENDYEACFCNLILSLFNRRRELKIFIMRLHTGESLAKTTPDWSWEQRKLLGQQYLYDLAKDIITYWDHETGTSKERINDNIKNLLSNLELDGYSYKNGTILVSESDVFDTSEETGILENLYLDLNLKNKKITLHHLTLSEEHYINKKWDDSISNSRKFLECILRETASAYSERFKGTTLSQKKFDRPAKIRDYLEEEGLLETKENKAIASVYGLLSETGSHPYMADNDQARLLRHLALTLSQFVMLRLKGRLKNWNPIKPILIHSVSIY